MKTKLNARGFTLLELLVAVTVISVLVAIALPSYYESILKGKRVQARTAILLLLQQQERYLTQNNTYLFFTNSLGTTNPATVPFATYSGDTNVNTAYWLSAGACSTTSSAKDCVVVSATPVTADDKVGTLSMNSAGVKSCTGTASGSTTVKVCWP